MKSKARVVGVRHTVVIREDLHFKDCQHDFSLLFHFFVLLRTIGTYGKPPEVCIELAAKLLRSSNALKLRHAQASIGRPPTGKQLIPAEEYSLRLLMPRKVFCSIQAHSPVGGFEVLVRPPDSCSTSHHSFKTYSADLSQSQVVI